jgi:hypothetical protein
LLQVSARPFHHLPTGGCAEQSFCEFNRHSTQDAGGMSNRSRIQSIRLPIFLPVAMLRGHDQQRRQDAKKKRLRHGSCRAQK